MSSADRPPTRPPHPAPAPAGSWLFLVVFVAGAALMAFEIVGSRLLAPNFGNSTYVWGSLIGVFLAALSTGYAWGGRLADRFPSAAALALVLELASMLVVGTVLFGDAIQDFVVRNDFGVRMNPLLASIAMFAPASILMGMVSPWAVRLKASGVERMGQTAGSLYGLSTAGSIAGTIAASFWLVQSAGSERTVLIVAGALAGCGLLTAVATRPRVATVAPGLACAAVVAVIAASIGSFDDERSYRGVGTNFSPVFRSGDFQPEFEPTKAGQQVEAVDSRYHRIRVVDYAAGQIIGEPSRVMHFDNSLQAAVPLGEDGDPIKNRAPVFPYQRAFDLVPAMVPDAKHVLFIGLGSGAAPMRLHQLRPDLKIDVVEIDPEVVRLARKHFGYDDAGKTIETHVGDGRSWLAASDETFDAIVVDAYFADSIPFQLTTREFFDIAREHLAADGIAVANIIGALEGRRSELLRSMTKTWSGSFDDVTLYPVPTQGQLRTKEYINVELFAANRGVLPASGGEAALVEGAGFPSSAGNVLDSTLQGIIDARRPASALPAKGVPTLTDDFAPVDSLLAVEEE